MTTSPVERTLGEWSGACDDVGESWNPVSICHCKGADRYNGNVYDNITCRQVPQEPYEKALSIFLFLYDLIVIAICIYWLFTFWGHRDMRAYRLSLRVRRPLYMILSYLMILPWVFEEGVATIYLFWAAQDPKRNQLYDGLNYWTNYDGSPIYFGATSDMVLHFFYWFGFWAWFQLKIFKLWMLRYDYEYSKEMSNIEWKDHLGLRTVEPTSFFIRYRSILGNSFLMFFLQLVILVIILFIQIFIRLVPLLAESPNASTIEGVTILIIALGEFFFIVWLMHQIREVDDNFYLRAESKRIFLASVIGGGAWITGLIIASASDIEYVWVRSGTILLFTTWICVFCYFETIWVLKRIDEDWVKRRQPTTQDFGPHDKTNIYLQFKLNDILQVQEGFEAMMRFLVKEFSCENLLCYVELSQYMMTWGQAPVIPPDPTRGGDPLAYSNLQSEADDDASITAEQRRNNKHKHNGSNGDQLHHSDGIDVERFEYFENPEFSDELTHYQYIMQKYVNDSACLQINISGGLRGDAHRMSPGPDSEEILKLFNNIRAELWQLMRDSFTRFRASTEYKKLAEVLANIPKFKAKIKGHNGQSSPRNHNHPPSVDFGINTGHHGHNGHNGQAHNMQVHIR